MSRDTARETDYVDDSEYNGPEEYVYRGELSGLKRWVTSVHHRDVGLMFGIFAVLSLLWGGVAVLLMRTELLTPNPAFVSVTTYNELFTTHGLTMLFLFGHPMAFALAIYFVPLLIGAKEMAYPRVTAIAFWLLPAGAVLIWSGFFLDPIAPELGPAATGWTIYAPLSQEMETVGIDLMLLGLNLTEISGIMVAITIIVTVFTERSEDIPWAQLDLFTWAMLTVAGLVLFAFPVLEAAIIMLLLDRNFGTLFFAAEGGGPILWQHLFWFFGHPEVYILILPAFALASLILPRFAGREMVAPYAMIYTTLAIGVLGFGLWAHHMFTTSVDPRIKFSFMAVSLAIAIPSSVKTFNWIGTLYNADIRLPAPMLFVVSFIANFIIGGITGVMVASIPFDLAVHDTHFIIGHFHYLFVGGLVFNIWAAIYYWFPILTGRIYNKTLAHLHFWLAMIGVQLAFFGLLLLGIEGMPRRYATYIPELVLLNRITTLGAYLIGAATVVWLVNVIYSWTNGRPIESTDPWGLEARGLQTPEWIWFQQYMDERGYQIVDANHDEQTGAGEK